MYATHQKPESASVSNGAACPSARRKAPVNDAILMNEITVMPTRLNFIVDRMGPILQPLVTSFNASPWHTSIGRTFTGKGNINCSRRTRQITCMASPIGVRVATLLYLEQS